MAHRTFRDDSGREWDAWEVVPTAVERRISRRMLASSASSKERRQVADARVVVPPELQKGWLAFQSGTERRRLAPIPEGWSELSDTELIALLQRAERRSRARRLIE
jgi:hypothetical protein